MGLLDTYQEGTQTSIQVMQDRPLESAQPSIGQHPSELIIFFALLLVGFFIYRKLRSRLRQPVNRVAFITLVPSYILSAIFIAHDMAQCRPLMCKPWLWESLSDYLSYDNFQLIMAMTVGSFIFAFFFDETVLRLLRWIKNG